MFPEKAACNLIICFKWCHSVTKLQCGQCTDWYSRTRDGTFIIPCILLSFLRPWCLHYPQWNLKPLKLPFNEDVKFWVRVTCTLQHVQQKKKENYLFFNNASCALGHILAGIPRVKHQPLRRFTQMNLFKWSETGGWNTSSVDVL